MNNLLLHMPWVAILLAVAAIVVLIVAWPLWLQRRTRAKAALFSIIAMAGVGAIYTAFGNPIYAYQQTKAEAQIAAADASIAALHAQLKPNPKQPKLWSQLSHEYLNIGRAGMARFAALQAVRWMRTTQPP